MVFRTPGAASRGWIEEETRIRKEEGIPETMCVRCGIDGRHKDAGGCINALRNMLALSQFREQSLQQEVLRLKAARPAAPKVDQPAPPRPASRAGARRRLQLPDRALLRARFLFGNGE